MWANVSLHSAYICTVCVRLVSVSSKCRIISSVCQFSMVTKGWLLRLQPQWQREMSQSPGASRKYTPTRDDIHTHMELTQHRPSPVWLRST